MVENFVQSDNLISALFLEYRNTSFRIQNEKKRKSSAATFTNREKLELNEITEKQNKANKTLMNWRDVQS